jgi:hypothetical protein
MTIPNSDVERLRRMTNEPTDINGYNDATLREYITLWKAIDSEGRSFEETDWVETYDLHAAAADIWEEKAAALFDKHDFSADSSSFSASQMYENARSMAEHHRARQKPTSKKSVKRPLENNNSDGLLYGGIYANIDPTDEDNLDEFWRLL